MTHFLYLVRHGAADPHDGPLSAAGQQQVPAAFANLIAGFSAAERAEGARLAAAALERFARPRDDQTDTYELVVTHNFLIGWLVSQALDAPPWRWMGVNQMNCAVSIIGYLSGPPAALISFNDAGHLPPQLRWTGFPAALRPASG
jgi:serine/threonine-protein phosphatase PGAM5